MLAAFQNITTNTTYGQVIDFVQQNFAGEGHELEALTLSDFNPNPAFLKNVTNPLVRAWSQTVHSFWTQLVRGTNDSTLCGGGSNCESSLIPLNHTFVVPGQIYFSMKCAMILSALVQVVASGNNITGTVSGLSRAC